MIVTCSEKNGFTLIELMIAIAVASIIMGLIGSTYYTYSRISSNQERVIEVQQNLRSSIYLLERDLLMAGYQPNPANPAGVGISIANSSRLELSYVVDEENNLFDTINYSLNGESLTRTVTDSEASSESFIVSDQVEEIQFLYIFRDGSFGLTTTVNQPTDNIVGVRISILAKSNFQQKGKTDIGKYRPLSFGETLLDGNTDSTEWGPYNDNFARKLITTTVFCRNLGVRGFNGI